MNMTTSAELCLVSRDFVSVKQEDKRVHVQKRLMLSNLREVNHEFKEKFLIEELGFPNLLRFVLNTVSWPEPVVHTLYVSVQFIKNVKLMMFSMRLSDLPTNHHCLARIICKHHCLNATWVSVMPVLV